MEAATAPLLERVRTLSPSALYETPDDQTWSAVKILSHVAEFVPYWARQAQVVARSSEVAAFGRTHDDPARIAAVETHARDTLAVAGQRLERALVDAVGILRAIPDEDWTKRGRHARRGEMTVGGIVDSFMLDHLSEHAQQLDQVLAATAHADSSAIQP